MVRSVYANTEIENKKEDLITNVDVSQVIRTLSVYSQATLDKLKEFSERVGRRTISEFNQLIDATELNEFIRIVFNDDHPTIDRKDGIRNLDYTIETNKYTGEKIIKTSKNGLSFCSSISQFIEVARIKARRSKQSVENIHIYTINENAQLPNGLAFLKDKPGHVSLIATRDMSWNEMLNKLKIVSNMLEFIATIPLKL